MRATITVMFLLESVQACLSMNDSKTELRPYAPNLIDARVVEDGNERTQIVTVTCGTHGYTSDARVKVLATGLKPVVDVSVQTPGRAPVTMERVTEKRFELSLAALPGVTSIPCPGRRELQLGVVATDLDGASTTTQPLHISIIAEPARVAH